MANVHRVRRADRLVGVLLEQRHLLVGNRRGGKLNVALARRRGEPPRVRRPESVCEKKYET